MHRSTARAATAWPITHTHGTPGRFARLRFITGPQSNESGTPGAANPNGDDGGNAGGDKSKSAAGDEPLGEGGKKALVAEREARAAAEAELAKLRKEIEDSKLSAEEKAAADLAAAQRDAAAAQLRALRYEVAADKGLDLKLAGRLTGSTRAELEADADELKSLIPAAAPTGPKPDRSQGGGNGDADKGASVSAGRQLWLEKHPSKKS
ncbi:hypothetical protein [Cellulomonas palmilytica]|uniref:hypothetical protein n=1 Tax=Cellulomonas palmilytica TaxID=2608402 RepID=UPI001F296BF8|nr:hypothetical protein [Cellulomonas palmilytica]UJP39334.1 hypothetical protein F1D97_13455 [Cellulomonas palmilytica]